MGTTNRSVDKKSGKIPISITEKAKKESKKRNKLSIAEILAALGMHGHRAGAGSKDISAMTINQPKFKKKRRRLQKQEHKASRK